MWGNFFKVGTIKIAIKVANHKIDFQLQNDKATIEDLALSISTLETITQDQIQNMKNLMRKNYGKM